MDIIDMLPDYMDMIRHIDQFSPFQAYTDYKRKYPVLFGAILQYLYMTDLESLRPMIENVDFAALLNSAESKIRIQFLKN